MCAENNCYFLDGNCFIDEIGINWYTDCGDPGHLNYSGAEKFSRWLSDKLVSLYDLSDMRGQEIADSWDRNLEWQNRVKKDVNLTLTYDFKTYMDNVVDEDYLVFVSFYGNNYQYYAGMLTSEQDIDGLVVDNGEYIWHHTSDDEIYRDEGKDYFSLENQNVGSKIVYNGNQITNGSLEGIEIVVFDRKVNNVVDTVYFSGSELYVSR